MKPGLLLYLLLFLSFPAPNRSMSSRTRPKAVHIFVHCREICCTAIPYFVQYLEVVYSIQILSIASGWIWRFSNCLLCIVSEYDLLLQGILPKNSYYKNCMFLSQMDQGAPIDHNDTFLRKEKQSGKLSYISVPGGCNKHELKNNFRWDIRLNVWINLTALHSPVAMDREQATRQEVLVNSQARHAVQVIYLINKKAYSSVFPPRSFQTVKMNKKINTI